jgi:hypothetical protein
MQTFHKPPILRPHYSSLSVVGHPRVGTKLHRVKGFLTRMMYLRQQERLHHRCQLKLTTYNPSFPTCLSHPRKCSPSLLNNPSAAPLPFQGFSNRIDRKVSDPCSCILSPSGINSQQFSHLQINFSWA